MTPSKRRDSRFALLRSVRRVLGLAVLTLIAVEVLARIWVASRWPESEIDFWTSSSGRRGSLTITAPFGYTNAPNHRRIDSAGRRFTHNAHGFRSREASPAQDRSRFRIFTAGASTVYGIYADDEDTASRVLEQELIRRYPDAGIEVQNAGVVGWTSEDTVRNIEHRILPLHPQVVVVMDGRNDLFPQIYNNYASDYSHFRTLDTEVIDRDGGIRRLFPWSYTVMMFTKKLPNVVGFEINRQSPAYGRIRFENMPTSEEQSRNAAAAHRMKAFGDNLRRCVELVRGAGAEIVLATIPFRKEAFGTGLLADMGSVDTIAALVDRNNATTRSLAAELRIPLVEGNTLSRENLLHDDCHFNEAGEKALGLMLAKAIDHLVRR